MKVTFDPYSIDECKKAVGMISMVYSLNELRYAGIGMVLEINSQEKEPQEKEPQTKEPQTKEPQVGVDANGVPWDKDYHAINQNKTSKGLWVRARGVTRNEYNDFANEFSPKVKINNKFNAPEEPKKGPDAPEEVNECLLNEIDEVLADLSEKRSFNDFEGWVSSMINWSKKGAKTLDDLNGEFKAQKMLLNHIKTV